ncbi:MAG: trypsin-like peptidase domain-containing protein, partial [Planctomycetales bacterium]
MKPKSSRCLPRQARFVTLFLLSLSLATGQRLSAEQPSGLAAAVAMEEVVIDAIAKSEKSVVAIGIFSPVGNDVRGRVPGNQRFNPDDKEQTPHLEAIPDFYGTGVVLDAKGLILTNHHVLKRKTKAAKKQAGYYRTFIRLADHPVWYEVKVKAADPYSDLAILEIDVKANKLKLPPIKMGK